MKFEDFIGNTQAVGLLKLLCADTKEHNMPFPHIGVFGPAGHGKTTITNIVAAELKRKFVYINSTAVRRAGLIRGLITHPENMANGAIIFMDEAHQLPKQIQDSLLSALEKPAKLVTSFKDQVLSDNLPDHITFAFATTDKSKMNNTLLSRLEEIELGEYTTAEKQLIAIGEFARQKIDNANLDMDAAVEIGRISRSGRHVIKLVDRVVRLARVMKVQKINAGLVKMVCEANGVDGNGLTKVDRRLLRYLNETGHCGIENLEVYLNMPRGQITNTIEPWLVRHKLIVRQASGRVITEKGRLALNGQRIDYE